MLPPKHVSKVQPLVSSLSIIVALTMLSLMQLAAQTIDSTRADGIRGSHPYVAAADPAPAPPPPAAAPLSSPANTTAGNIRTSKVGLGLQAIMPTAGLSAIINLDEKMSVQGLLGMFIAGVKTYSARFLYHFRDSMVVQPYVYGGVGAWSNTFETAMGFMGGGGVEYFLEALPQLGLNAEVSVISVTYRDAHNNIAGITFGGGVHYYF